VVGRLALAGHRAAMRSSSSMSQRPPGPPPPGPPPAGPVAVPGSPPAGPVAVPGPPPAGEPAAGVPYTLPAVAGILEFLTRLGDLQGYIAANGPGRPNDGIGCFNALYRRVTERVRDGLGAGAFRDPRFVTELDVIFGNRYLDALRAGHDRPGAAPLPWRVLLERRADQNLAPLQFAAAGVNAHIDYDLAAAVVATWRRIGGGPDDPAQHASYQQIDRIFAEEMDGLRHVFESSAEAAIDRGRVAGFLDFLGDWTVDLTRDIAWGHACRMWALRHLGGQSEYLEALALTAGAVGRTLLVAW
jgi:hypothetical protein